MNDAQFPGRCRAEQDRVVPGQFGDRDRAIPAASRCCCSGRHPFWHRDRRRPPSFAAVGAGAAFNCAERFVQFRRRRVARWLGLPALPARKPSCKNFRQSFSPSAADGTEGFADDFVRTAWGQAADQGQHFQFGEAAEQRIDQWLNRHQRAVGRAGIAPGFQKMRHRQIPLRLGVRVGFQEVSSS